MQQGLIITVREKEWEIYVTDEKETYRSWVQEGKVCFSLHELDRIMDEIEEDDARDDHMHWVLVCKKVTPGVRIDNVKERRVTTPKTSGKARTA